MWYENAGAEPVQEIHMQVEKRSPQLFVTVRFARCSYSRLSCLSLRVIQCCGMDAGRTFLSSGMSWFENCLMGRYDECIRMDAV